VSQLDVKYDDMPVNDGVNFSQRHFFRDRDIWRDTGVKTRDKPRQR